MICSLWQILSWLACFIPIPASFQYIFLHRSVWKAENDIVRLLCSSRSRWELGSANQMPSCSARIWKEGSCVVQIVADHSRSRVILQSSALRFLTSASGNSSGNCPDRKGGSVNLGPEVVPGNSTYHVLLLLFWYHLIHSKNPFSLKLAMMALLLQLNINPWSHIQNILTCPSSSL